MRIWDLTGILEDNPVIAAAYEENWSTALTSPCQVLFHLKANIMTIEQQATAAHEAGKAIFVHLDLANGIGKDKAGIEFLARCGVDGIISTRSQLIRLAKECKLLTVQRFFILDSQGLDSIEENLSSAAPDLLELMPGVIRKAIVRFAGGSIPIIAGGLVETKTEVTEALSAGAFAVSTSAQTLWYL